MGDGAIRARQLAMMTVVAVIVAGFVLFRSSRPQSTSQVDLPDPLARNAMPAADAAAAQPDEIAEKIGENLYRLGNVIADTAKRRLVCEGRVNMEAGALEYLAVTPEGKRHESVLTLDLRPMHFQIALILIGLEPKGGLRFQGDEQPPQGHAVRLTIEWREGDQTQRIAAEKWVRDVRDETPMPAGAWVFSGSRVTASGFAADEEGSLIGIYRDPVAIINNRLPEGADDTVYEVFRGVVPKVGTPVKLIIEPTE